MDSYTIEPIAYIHNNYKDKFGIPRQSNLARTTPSEIIFTNKFRDENLFRGLSDYSHIWLLWIFSKSNKKTAHTATVRPPRLGGNKRVGIFATRSPYHPNRLGLSCVKIESIEKRDNVGTVIKVRGADLLDGTPIVDIKPYLSFTDSHADAICGFADECKEYSLDVAVCEGAHLELLSDEEKNEIFDMLKNDPRPSYQNFSDRIYAFFYSDFEIKFKCDGEKIYLLSVEKSKECKE